MKLNIEQWRLLDKRMAQLFNELPHLVDDDETDENMYSKYLELLSLHCEIPNEEE
jgi:hypothetical protein